MRMVISRFRMVKVFAPILVKLLLMEPLIASIAVRIPTRAVMPKEMISTVRMVRSNCPRIEFSDIFIFSVMKEDKLLCLVVLIRPIWPDGGSATVPGLVCGKLWYLDFSKVQVPLKNKEKVLSANRSRIVKFVLELIVFYLIKSHLWHSILK